MKVGVIGLGTMGMGAALNLLRKGHAVTGCELREAGRAEFAAAGGAAVASPAELPADLEAVVVFVITAAQTEQVLFGENGCLARLAKGAVILCCATVAPEAARALGTKIADAGFLIADNLNPQKARLLLSLALTVTSDPAGVERIFATY